MAPVPISNFLGSESTIRRFGGWRKTVDSRIRILLRIIEERHGMLQMSSEQIGSLIGVGEARVFRLFSAQVGKTFRRHLLEVRMQRATELLKDGLPIKTIAAYCGYSAVSNFYRDFKAVYGTSPMQMRLLLIGVPLLVKPSRAAGTSDPLRSPCEP
jgi:AraC-like DNA-binding protein